MIPQRDPLDLFKSDLEAEIPSELHKARECLTQAFTVIEMHLSRKVPMTKVAALFNKRYSLNLSIARFRQLLKDERANRSSPQKEAQATQENRDE